MASALVEGGPQIARFALHRLAGLDLFQRQGGRLLLGLDAGGPALPILGGLGLALIAVLVDDVFLAAVPLPVVLDPGLAVNLAGFFFVALRQAGKPVLIMVHLGHDPGHRVDPVDHDVQVLVISIVVGDE